MMFFPSVGLILYASKRLLAKGRTRMETYHFEGAVLLPKEVDADHGDHDRLLIDFAHCADLLTFGIGTDGFAARTTARMTQRVGVARDLH